MIDQVAIIGSEKQSNKGITKANIRKRYNRNPVVGDKFSSRHG